MAAVVRLLTVVDLDANDPGPDSKSLAVSARLEAVLADGRRVVLLDDRGWGGTICVSWDREPSEQERKDAERLRGWDFMTVEEMEQTARDVVGPDEAIEDETQADMERGHWETLARVIQDQGIEVEAADLKVLPHDVELSDRVLARIREGRGAPAPGQSAHQFR
jgi:hypothetical protein